jgi:hypothetical protein
MFIAEMNFNEQHVMQTDSSGRISVRSRLQYKAPRAAENTCSTMATAQQLSDHNVPGKKCLRLPPVC